jgi:hypothetical protein
LGAATFCVLAWGGTSRASSISIWVSWSSIPRSLCSSRCSGELLLSPARTHARTHATHLTVTVCSTAEEIAKRKPESEFNFLNELFLHWCQYVMSLFPPPPPTKVASKAQPRLVMMIPVPQTRNSPPVRAGADGTRRHSLPAAAVGAHVDRQGPLLPARRALQLAVGLRLQRHAPRDPPRQLGLQPERARGPLCGQARQAVALEAVPAPRLDDPVALVCAPGSFTLPLVTFPHRCACLLTLASARVTRFLVA